MKYWYSFLYPQLFTPVEHYSLFSLETSKMEISKETSKTSIKGGSNDIENFSQKVNEFEFFLQVISSKSPFSTRSR